MGSYDLLKMQQKLKTELDSERFQHTMGVMYTSACLAMAHGYDLGDAQCAGLLHDCAKCIPNQKKLKLCEKNKIPITDFEREHPFLIHAKLGAFLAKEKYGVKNPEILSAIESHTTGKPEMTRLEMIIYIADYSEPMRYKASCLPEIRRLAFVSLEECMYEILRQTMDYLGDDPTKVDMTSLKAYNYYRSLHYAAKE